MTDGERLPCGVAVADLLERYADGLPPTEHSAGCPYCRARRQSLAGEWEQVRQAANAPVEVPAGLPARIIGRLRAEWGADSGDLLLPGDHGTTRIGPGVISALTRDAAAGIPDVRIVHCRYDGARIDLGVGLRADAPLPEAAERLRDRISRELGQRLGVPPPPVDVTIVDVWY
jgi:hypothetical protein